MIPLTVVLALCAAAAPQAEPQRLNRLGAIWTGGLLDLMTEPKRDVTASFAALVSSPIGFPKDKRAAEFSMLSVALPRFVRTADPKLAAEVPALVGLCSKPDGSTRWNLEAILQGKTRVWTLTLLADTNIFSTPTAPGQPPHFFFSKYEPVEVTADQRFQNVAALGSTCARIKRDAAGEVFFENEPEPSRFEAKLDAPFAVGSDHLLDFADDQDLAVAGLMPAEVFANLHRELPRPRTAGVLNLAIAADALSFMGRLTLVAVPPTGPAGASAVLFVEGRTEITLIGFKNGSFAPVQFVAPAAAISGPWSKWSWSLVDPRMPAEVLLDMTPASAKCLDALPKLADEHLATKVQQCFDLSLADAGAAFRVRRERWLEAVRQHETAAADTVESFCADQGALAREPFFQRRPAGKNRDAGPLLTATLGWEQRTGAKLVPGSLKLAADLDKKFSGAGFMELSDKDLASAAATDTTFLAKLADFERWEFVEPSGPLVSDSQLNAADAPFPEFSRLTLAAKLHLRRGAKAGKLVAAARDVRHAARLAFSTENLIGQSVALGLLSLERRAFEWAQKHKVSTAGWTPVDEDALERARRVVRSAPAFFSPMAKDETFARATACDQLTHCSGLTEVVAVSAGLESLLREPWRARYAKVLAAIAVPDERCSFGLARHWSTRTMVDVEEARRSRNQEVIAGGMMSRAATAFYLPALERWYGPH